MNAQTTSPVMNTLRREVDRIFDRVWEGMPQLPILSEWNTAVDVSETADFVTVQLELPGIDIKDLRLNLKDQMLMVRAEKRRDIERNEAHFFQAERCYGSVARNIHLPSSVDPNKVTATFKNGVLAVTLEKAAETKGSPIVIKAL
jgi:HSP20 family protein